MSIQIVPLQSEQAYDKIDRVIDLIKSTGLRYEVGPFNTCIEGEIDELLELIKQSKKLCFEEGVEELLINCQFHLKKNQDCLMNEKVEKHR